ncbi:MAG: hypothetical protein JRH15_08290 [Deltaproteobacteria bacterium]|nr:hypothetical protein [Deltaproteobacteria bacterium]
MRHIIMALLAALFAIGALACQTRHEVSIAPVEIKPIHITIDVTVRIDRALDDFFSDIDDTEDSANTSRPDDAEIK